MKCIPVATHFPFCGQRSHRAWRAAMTLASGCFAYIQRMAARLHASVGHLFPSGTSCRGTEPSHVFYLHSRFEMAGSPHMPTAKEYRQQAQEYLELAKEDAEPYAMRAMM